jgi:hypothetical protein
MRRWGRVPICKASRPDHELGIQTHTTLLRKERKEVIWGTEGRSARKQSGENDLQKRRERFSTLELKGKLRSKLVLGARSHGKGFRYKMINEADE